jgi:DNA-binding NarL/FixJ family response regulator
MDSNLGAALHIRVFIVSNVRLHREGLAALLRECPSIEVLGTNSVQEAQNAVPTTTTEVALLDAPSHEESDIVRAPRRICAGCAAKR